MQPLPLKTLPSLLAAALLSSCGEPDPAQLPVKHTPPGGKVDLSRISLTISNAAITRGRDGRLVLGFDYSIHNAGKAHLAFPCIYSNTDDLIDVKLSDKNGEPVLLGKRPMEGLTLTEPRPIKLPVGISTRSLKIPLAAGLQNPGSPVTLHARLDAPSRYDELRSTISAPPVSIAWPAPSPESPPQP